MHPYVIISKELQCTSRTTSTLGPTWLQFGVFDIWVFPLNISFQMHNVLWYSFASKSQRHTHIHTYNGSMYTCVCWMCVYRKQHRNRNTFQPFVNLYLCYVFESIKFNWKHPNKKKIDQKAYQIHLKKSKISAVALVWWHFTEIDNENIEWCCDNSYIKSQTHTDDIIETFLGNLLLTFELKRYTVSACIFNVILSMLNMFILLLKYRCRGHTTWLASN